jgi:membrane fusion protein, multidrug efflux system
MRYQAAHGLLVIVAALTSACTPAPAQPGGARSAAAPVKVVTVVAGTAAAPRLLPLTGTLKAAAESAVAANASGRVVRTYVERGSVVAQGAALLQLDTRMAALTAAEARANLEGTRTQKELADRECQRNQRLFERRLITQQEFEKTDSACKVQRQSLAAAESKQRQTAISVGDATVRAPFRGVVSERYVNVGEYVAANTKVVQLVQNDPVRVELTAGEADAGAIRSGQSVTFEVKALPGRTFTAKVRYVAPALRTATRDLIFEAVASNRDGALKPGMFVTAWMETGTEERVTVPQAALRTDGDTVRAFVVKGGRLEERIVQLAPDVGGRAAIKVGIAAGERVVSAGTDRLRDGLPVME